LELAVEEFLGGREDLEGCGWRTGSIQITSDRSRIYIDCSGGEDEPVPVWAVDWELDNPVAPTLASFGDLVSTWITAIDLDAWKWNADSDGWDRDWDWAGERCRPRQPPIPRRDRRPAGSSNGRASWDFACRPKREAQNERYVSSRRPR
jgi:hypothetical protein